MYSIIKEVTALEEDFRACLICGRRFAVDSTDALCHVMVDHCQQMTYSQSHQLLEAIGGWDSMWQSEMEEKDRDLDFELSLLKQMKPDKVAPSQQFKL